MDVKRRARAMKKLSRRTVDSDEIHDSSVDIHMLMMRQNREIYRLHKEMTHLRAENTKLKKNERNISVTRFITEVPNNPLLQEIIENSQEERDKHSRSWTPRFVSLAFVLYVASPKSYRIQKKIFTMPSVSTLYQRVGPKLNFLKKQLTMSDYSGIKSICEQWREEQQINGIIDVILGFDAAVFKQARIDEEDCTNCIAFLVLPIHPNIATLLILLLPRPSGSLGKDGPYRECRQIVDTLWSCGVHVISVATDGDRSYLTYQVQLFPHYSCRISEGLDRLCDEFFERNIRKRDFWWIADILHVLKCQRCRLKDNLFLRAKNSFNCTSLNRILGLKDSLSKFKGPNKMNDIYAVRLFSIDSLVKLMCNEGNPSEIEYIMPFALWYAAVSIGDLTRITRLGLLKIAFRIFSQWARRRIRSDGKLDPNRELWEENGKEIKFAVIEADLIRYLNSVLFTYSVIKNYDDVGLDRIGTHLVENFFGMMRIACHYNDTWDRCISYAAKASMANEILSANGIKNATRRDFTIAGVKVFRQQDIEKLDIPDLFTHGMVYLDFREGKFTDSDPVAFLLADLILLFDWQENHSAKLYNPGPVANESALSRILAFSTKSNDLELRTSFKWTPSKKKKACLLNEDDRHNYSTISEEIGGGCTRDDVEEFFKRLEDAENARLVSKREKKTAKRAED
jgi:hypothetical protein